MPFSFCHASLKEQKTGNDGMSKVTSQTQTVTGHIKLDQAFIYIIHIFMIPPCHELFLTHENRDDAHIQCG